MVTKSEEGVDSPSFYSGKARQLREEYVIDTMRSLNDCVTLMTKSLNFYLPLIFLVLMYNASVFETSFFRKPSAQ